MKYRNEGINKKKKNINFILIYSFIASVSILIFFVIRIDTKIDVLTTENPLLKIQLNNIENSILSEKKTNNELRLSIKRVGKKGMIRAYEGDFNIIRTWWGKENN